MGALARHSPAILGWRDPCARASQGHVKPLSASMVVSAVSIASRRDVPRVGLALASESRAEKRTTNKRQCSFVAVPLDSC